MVEAVMAALGVNCIQLGSDTPPLEVAAAARETAAEIVALSFSACFPSKSLVRTVTVLRAGLPPATALWIGGGGVAASAALVAGVDVVGTLDAIEPALARWRADGATQ
jgi:methanogenic corrinoid protein MtbC1